MWSSVDNVLLIVGQQESGEGKCDNHADKSEQGAPDRQGEEDDGGIEPHRFAHNFGRKNVVAYTLAYEINQQTLAEHWPELHRPLHRIDETNSGHGDKGDILEIRYHVEHSDEYAEDYRQRDTDD